MRHLAFHHLLRHGGVCALLLVSGLPVPAQVTAPASAQRSVATDAPSITRRPRSIQEAEQEIRQIEQRLKARGATPSGGNSEPGGRQLDTDRKRLNWLRSFLYRMSLLANEKREVDWQAIERGRAHRDRMPTPQRKNGNGIRSFSAPTPGESVIVIETPEAPPVRWQFVGPRNLRTPTRFAFGPGVVSGRINGVAFDPNRAGTYYVAAPLGGVWKTTDRGRTWTPLMETLPGQATTCVTVDPNNSDIVYVGTGDYNGSDGVGFGLLKSTNGGATWTQLGTAQFGIASIRKVWVDPLNSQHLLVTAGPNGLFRSTNGGTTFTNIFSTTGSVSNVAYNANRTVLYMSVDRTAPGSNAGIFRSTNNGATWTRVLVSGGGRMDVAPSLVNPNVVYALDEGARAVYKSENGGTTWVNTTSNLPRSEWVQAYYDFYIACSPHGNQDMVWVGLLDLILSKDGGATWQPIGNVYTSAALTHTDQHGFAYNPRRPYELLIGNDGGVYRLTFSPEDDFFRFESLNANLGVTQFYGLDIHPSVDTYLIGGTQDNATPRSNFNPLQWDNVGLGDGGHAFVNPLNVPNQYSTSQSYVDGNGEDWLAMLRTDDNWTSAFSIDTDVIENPLFITAEAMDRTRPQFLFAGGSNVVRYDASSGTSGSWQQTDDNLNAPAFSDNGSPAFPEYPGPVGPVSAMGVSRGVDPGDPKLVLAGTVFGAVFVSSEDGQNFQRVDLRHGRIPPPPFGPGEEPDGTPFLDPLLPSRAVTSIQGSIFNNNRVFITMGGTGGGHVYRGDNVTNPFAVNWVDISGVGAGRLPDVPAYSLAILPYEQGRRMYVGTEIGVFYTENGGQTWSNVTVPLGLPNVRVTRLEFNPSTGTLTAATYGRGIWQIQVGNNVLLQLNTVLQYYRGSRSRLNAVVQIYVPGQTPDTFPPIEVKRGPLTTAGYFIQRVSSRGTFDIYITVPRFLRKRVPQVSIISGNPVSTGTMYCGDVNGDNVIDDTDVELVRQAMGRFNTGTVDLDGDGRVTSRDLSIVQQNLGRQGD
ncbi:MAG: dockerin type I domain-containing protein [Chloroherpetonaceae bacterium]|nr:dockerin type I domain-containing protein [Chthonomonadaceae bacterium]MDW8206887.1 dockerin type I domain-containing protein [Chloroherpetonaceae bacterium]